MRRISVPTRRRVLGLGAGLAAFTIAPARAQGQAQVVRIGLPTKTYWPTIIAETALRHKLFEKEGIKAELTIYRSGAEGFEAISAGAAAAPGIRSRRITSRRSMRLISWNCSASSGYPSTVDGSARNPVRSLRADGDAARSVWIGALGGVT